MKRSLRKLALAVVTLLFVTHSHTAFAAPPHTGVVGRTYHYVSYGPPMGVEIEPGVWVWIGPGDVQMPVATSMDVMSAHNGRKVARISTDSEGNYSMSLPPGRYLLVPDVLIVNASFDCTVQPPAPIEVEVKAMQFTLANVFYFSEGPPCVTGGGSKLIPPAATGKDEVENGRGMRY